MLKSVLMTAAAALVTLSASAQTPRLVDPASLSHPAPATKAPPRHYVKGEVQQPPFELGLNRMTRDSMMNVFTFIDQAPNAVWSITDNTAVLMTESHTEDVDAWLITPKVHFEAGKPYNIGFRTANKLGNSDFVEIKYGSGDNPEAMTDTVMPAQLFNNRNLKYLGGNVQFDQDCDLQFGYHVVTPKDSAGGNLWVVSFRVQPVMPNTPWPVTEAVDGGVKITWSQPQLNYAGKEPLEKSDFVYRVVRFDRYNTAYSDTLAVNLTDTCYTDIFGDVTPPAMYIYKVSAFWRGLGDPKSGLPDHTTQLDGTDGKYYATGYFTPAIDRRFWMLKEKYGYDVTYEREIGTIIDANADGQKFLPATSQALSPVDGKTFRCLSMQKQNQRDDYFVTPPIKVKGGHIYRVNGYFGSYSASFKESMEILGGYAPSVDGLADTIAPLMTIQTPDITCQHGTFTAKEDGLYYLGFHAKTDYKPGFLYFYGYDVDDGSPAGTLDVVTDVVYTNDYDNGSNAVSVSFKAPSQTIEETAATNIGRIELMRDTVLVKTWDNPAPGAPLTYIDTPAKSDYYTYSIRAYNDKGAGRNTEIKVYAGINIAIASTVVKTALADNGTDMVVNWAPVTKDRDGYDINSRFVTYNLYLNNTEGTGLVAENVADTCATVHVAEPGQTQYGRIIVRTVTPSGESVGAYGENLHVGPAIAMPWGESFRQGIHESLAGWESDRPEWADYACLTQNTYKSFDDDAGCLFVGGLQNRVSTNGLSTPLIHVTGTNPVARLYTTSKGSAVNENKLTISVDDGTGWKELASMPQKFAGNWGFCEAKLDDYVGKDIRVKFTASAISWPYTEMDNLMVFNSVDGNTGIQSVNTNYNAVYSGTRNPVYVKVRNYGSTAPSGVSSLNVELYRDGKKVAVKRCPSIDPYKSAMLTFYDDVPSGLDSVAYTARLSAAGSYDGDNERTEAFAVTPSRRPTATELQGHDAQGVAELAWTAPSTDGLLGDTRTETFEQYASWAKDGIGDWTLIDADGQPITGIMGRNLPVAQSPGSWFVVDQTISGWFDSYFDSYPTYEGDKALASRFTYGTTYGDEYVDDWAILPELSGEAQTIRLVAPKFQDFTTYWISSTGKEIADFQPIEVAKAAPTTYMLTTALRRLSIDVPEGTRYLAVRHYGAKAQAWQSIDVVQYTPAAKDADILGYNVYCDGVRVNDAPVAETAFSHASGAGDHTYYVTTVMKDGESEPSNTVSLAVSGLGIANADAARVVGRYNAAGQEVDATYRGVVILKYSDGRVTKTVVK